MVSHLTMFLAVDDFTNRNRISVTVLLCLTTLFGTLSIKQDFPKTTEFKYVDLWFLWYLASTFLVICHHVMIDKLSRNSFNRSPKTKPSLGKMKKEDRFPIMINYIGALFFFAVNISFNIVYFSIATWPCMQSYTTYIIYVLSFSDYASLFWKNVWIYQFISKA